MAKVVEEIADETTEEVNSNEPAPIRPIPLKDGDFIIHMDYGAGQVAGSRHLALGGKKKLYYKLNLPRTEVWLPEDKCTTQWLRYPTTEATIKKALKAINDEVRPLPDHTGARKTFLTSVTAHSEPLEIVALLRDLRAWHKSSNGLTGLEKETWDRLLAAFLSEWAATSPFTMEEAEAEFEKLLKKREL